MVREYICVGLCTDRSIAQPLFRRKCFELNIKLYKVGMRTKKVVITFVVIGFIVKSSWDIFNAFIPSEFWMFV